MVDIKPYATVAPLLGALQTWLSPEDAERLGAYSLYEGIYRNFPESFRLVQRGSEQNPIYLPSAKTIIEAKNRYLAKRWTYALDPSFGSDAERVELDAYLKNLFRREMVWSKFKTQKRYGLVRGDSVWHIVGDPNKAEGSRLSVYEVDPGAFFPIDDPWNPDKRLGVHLVEPVELDGGKVVIKRQTYRKTESGTISYELTWWQAGAWDDRNGGELKPADEIPEGEYNAPVAYELDPRITSIPVYHIKNNRITGQPFGTSELEGFETLLTGINQAISDEDLVLALEGLGLYATTSSPPVDDEGNETEWRLGPGWVVEIDTESTFERVTGVSSVEPYQTHMNKLETAMREASSVPDIAIGNVDVQTAESGIALAFKMGPILSANEEKEDEILSIMDHLLYDLVTMWIPTYEGWETTARAASIVDDPLPVNRKATLDEIVTMLSTNPPLISAEYARTLLSEKLGYDFPDEMSNTVVLEAAKIAEARNVDPFASRAAQELEESGS